MSLYAYLGNDPGIGPAGFEVDRSGRVVDDHRFDMVVGGAIIDAVGRGDVRKTGLAGHVVDLAGGADSLPHAKADSVLLEERWAGPPQAPESLGGAAVTNAVQS